MSTKALDFLDSILADAEAIRETRKTEKAKKKKDRLDYLALTRPKTKKVNYTIKEEWEPVSYVRTVTVQTCLGCQETSRVTHPQLLQCNRHITEESQVFKPAFAYLLDLPHKLLEIFDTIPECGSCFLLAEKSTQLHLTLTTETAEKTNG